MKFIQWEEDGLFNKYKIKRELNFPTEKKLPLLNLGTEWRELKRTSLRIWTVSQYWFRFSVWIHATVLSKTGEGNGNPLQYSCLENPMDGGAW